MKKITFFLGLVLIIILSCKKDHIDYSNILSSNAWKVNRYVLGDAIAFSIATEDYIFKFNSENKTYNLNLDVNDCNGSFLIQDKIHIVIESPSCSEICCDSDYAEDLLKIIPIISVYQIKGSRLELIGDGGTIILEKYID